MDLSKLLAKANQLDATLKAFTPIWPDNRVREVITKVCAINERLSFASVIRVEWNKNLTRCIGRAVYRTNIIELSTLLMERASEKDREETVAHETAHLLCKHIYGPIADTHGPYWGSIMIRAGYPPTRCHAISTHGLKAARARTVIGRRNNA